MFGKNKVVGQNLRADGALIVNSIFPTLQGEGPDAGTPAVFIRLAKCNLRCFFCDTEFERGSLMPVEAIVEAVRTANSPGNLVVITGGEPLLQNIVPLVKALNRERIRVSVETAGTVYVPGLEEVFHVGGNGNPAKANMIVCSPKTPKLNPKLMDIVGAFKYIIKAGETDKEDGLPSMSTQVEGKEAKLYRPTLMQKVTVPIYVQPCDEQDDMKNEANLMFAASLCMLHGYRLSVQTHKLAGLP